MLKFYCCRFVSHETICCATVSEATSADSLFPKEVFLKIQPGEELVCYTVRKVVFESDCTARLKGTFVSAAVCVFKYTHVLRHVSVLSGDQCVIRGELNLILNFQSSVSVLGNTESRCKQNHHGTSVGGDNLPSRGRNRTCSDNEGEANSC